MAKWIPSLPPLAACLVAAALLRHSWTSPVASDFSLHPLWIVVLALIYPLVGRKVKAR